jgi:hypothetical protein
MTPFVLALMAVTKKVITFTPITNIPLNNFMVTETEDSALLIVKITLKQKSLSDN